MTDLGALFERFENAFTLKLLTNPSERKRYKVVFDTKALVKHDIQTLTNVARDGIVNGIITQNEGREMLQLPVLEGEEYNQVRQQMQMVNPNVDSVSDTEEENIE